ncbi:MAG: prolipoprotein diacylglyceryl transferase [Chloroflexi bacterium]|nr:prolipoprotein diacylglyceryl transferase [Chloroflexota bacterium]
MLPILQIGPLAIQTPGLILLLGLWLGLSLSERLAPRFNSDANSLYNLVFFALVAGLLGARLGYAMQNMQHFIASPISLVSLNPGLLDISSGLAVGLLVAFIYGNRKALHLWSTLDAITPMLAVFAIALALSHYASGSAFGSVTTLPWGIYLWSAKRHPSQIYEAILAIIILWNIWPKYENNVIAPKFPGATFLLFLALSAGARLFI